MTDLIHEQDALSVAPIKSLQVPNLIQDSYSPTHEQQLIIDASEGYVRCAAVPGSGKTFCITNRMASLINKGIDPTSIVALTFTNKAASNMKARLKKMIGDKGTCYAGTFHGFCKVILNREIYRLSWAKDFSIAVNSKQINMIRNVIADELHLSLKDITVKECLKYIADEKSSTNYVELMIGTDKTPLMNQIQNAQTTLESIYYRYLLNQVNNGVLDFHDMIAFAVYILVKHPDALQYWQNICQYVLCDEYQDVNILQENLLGLLCGKFHNLTVAGDDDQCIYGWRDSKVEYIVDFEKRYPNSHEFALLENFRSTPEIINVANSLIIKNQNRLAKKMFTNNPHGEKPVYNNLPTADDEASWIAQTIQSNVEQGKRYLDHAILVRTSLQTPLFEKYFAENKIPYKIMSGAKFYGSEEIKTVIAYLGVINNLNDEDFAYTINRPKRRFAKTSLEKLKEYAENRHISMIEALGERINSGAEKRKEVIEYYNGIIKLHNSHNGISCVDIANEALDLGYRQDMKGDPNTNKIDNVTELLSIISRLEEENQEFIPLNDLVSHFALLSDADTVLNRDAVQIMTIHSAKGLEFDTVFVPGLVQGIFANEKYTDHDRLEEERRVFYVAITRAKTMLYLSSYDMKEKDGYPCKQSGFLGDIEVDLLNCINDSKITEKYLTPPMIPKAHFQVGDLVQHSDFGIGAVVSVNTHDRTYEIIFMTENGSTNLKRFTFRAPLTALSVNFSTLFDSVEDESMVDSNDTVVEDSFVEEIIYEESEPQVIDASSVTVTVRPVDASHEIKYNPNVTVTIQNTEKADSEEKNISAKAVEDTSSEISPKEEQDNLDYLFDGLTLDHEAPERTSSKPPISSQGHNSNEDGEDSDLFEGL